MAEKANPNEAYGSFGTFLEIFEDKTRSRGESPISDKEIEEAIFRVIDIMKDGKTELFGRIKNEL